MATRDEPGVDLVIFDCDGVLVDTEPIAVRLSVELGRELGWALTPDEVLDRFVGRSERSIHALISERLGAEVAETWQTTFRDRHRLALETELMAVRGIVDALAQIPLPTCVASSGSHEKMRHTLGMTGLYERFAGRIFSATEVAHGKPAPDLFLHAADRMGVAPEGCVVVEDSRYGVAAARAAGMRSLGYCGGITPREWLEGPDTVVFDDMRDLPRLLGCVGLDSGHGTR
jgi:HAD superfamily hydrolase (TIGR01509 family)